jgi:histidyl-tRNA synthetase
MRDFLPADVIRRQYVFGIISSVFELHGFEPLQTPVLELSDMLMGKYGEDAEKLIFYANHPGQEEQKLALRYDLTVPLARMFGMHEGQLSLPFKRYQIAPVWRAERPARGRFREFYQCDADTVGIAGMEADSETISIVIMALQRLGFDDFVVKINNRKLLTGIGHYAGLSGTALSNLYRSIDKLAKIGFEGVREDLLKAGIGATIVTRMIDMLANSRAGAGYGAGATIIGRLRELLSEVPAAMQALSELETLLDYTQALNIPGEYIEVDPTVVRGLSYYTGPIFEAVSLSADPEERVGSLAGGGRYDDLIGLFRKDSLPTVGVALGVERLIALLDKRGMYPDNLGKTVVQVLVTVWGPETKQESLRLAAELRAAGIRTELFMQDARIGKQIGYADKRPLPLVRLYGPDEQAANAVKFKRLADQYEDSVPRAQLISETRKLLGGNISVS